MLQAQRQCQSPQAEMHQLQSETCHPPASPPKIKQAVFLALFLLHGQGPWVGLKTRCQGGVHSLTVLSLLRCGFSAFAAYGVIGNVNAGIIMTIR